MPTASNLRPPLKRTSQAWRYALCVVVSLLSTGNGAWDRISGRPMLFWFDVVIGVLALGLVTQRRRWPLLVALIVVASTTVSVFAIGPAVLGAVSLATRQRIVEIVGVGAAFFVGLLTFQTTQPIAQINSLVVNIVLDLLVAGGVLAWGAYIGSRRELDATLRARVASAESEQELRLDSARAAERARIAREMHDVVAHRISQVSMHSGALAFREDLDTEELRAGLSQIQAQANLALNELRSVLGVLRDPTTAEIAQAPVPSAGDIEELIDQARRSGNRIEYDVHVNLDDVPEVAGRTMFRIIQEGLTNAAKHAPGATVRIRVSGTPEAGVTVVIRNPLGFDSVPAAPGSGLGLVGLAERAHLSGGRLESRTAGGVFELSGWLPWTA